MAAKMEMDRLIQIAIAVSAEKRMDVLMDRILMEAMRITGCDGGTVYIREEAHLVFWDMVTKSKGIHLIRNGKEELLPPVPLDRAHVCACAALEHRVLNIEDVYTAEAFNFTGTRKYDQMNAYRTKSMLVVPMEDEQGRNIGVLQLINALDHAGHIVPFDPAEEGIIRALGSLAAVTLNKERLREAVTEVLNSLVSVMVEVIDKRTPYNANHTRSMAAYAERFIAWLDAGDRGWRFKEEEKAPFLMSVWLHDLGKVVIPREIMDKPTRLGNLAKERMAARIETGLLMDRIRALENPAEAEAALVHRKAVEEAWEIIQKVNEPEFRMTEETLETLENIRKLTIRDAAGTEHPLLTAENWEALTIWRGTLTAGERTQMEAHVSETIALLSKVRFGGIYAPVPVWAGQHHEMMDGSGYPNHLTGEHLSPQTRLLTILDIYDAITSDDRPYKKKNTPEDAFAILEEKASRGQVDGKILKLFRESGAWQKEPPGKQERI